MKSIWNVLTVLLTFAYFAFALIVGQEKRIDGRERHAQLGNRRKEKAEIKIERIKHNEA